LKKACVSPLTAADSAISFKGYRFPPDVISYAVWLYYRIPPSLRMVEEILAARGIELTFETVRKWAGYFGLAIAKRIRTTASGRGDKWHLDEMVVTLNDKQHYLWHAVDQHGALLDVLVQSRRDKAAAIRLMCKLLKRFGKPRVIVTDKLRSYAAANHEIGLNVEHRQHKGLNNRIENAHEPTRVREKVMRRFKSARQLQRFASIDAAMSNRFMGCRYNRCAEHMREVHSQAKAAWEWASCVRLSA